VLFYHSSCPQPGIAGLAEIASRAYPDPSQFDPDSPYHDPRSSRESPRWMLVDVRATRRTRLIGLDELRSHPELAELLVLRRGNRLSITPVESSHWRFITSQLLRKDDATSP
jgi:predicted RNA-binding protein with PUA-like domain